MPLRITDFDLWTNGWIVISLDNNHFGTVGLLETNAFTWALAHHLAVSILRMGLDVRASRILALVVIYSRKIYPSQPSNNTYLKSRCHYHHTRQGGCL